MRTIEITEIDSGCYKIKTKDFQDSDSVEYSWDSVPRNFYGEYQMATVDKRKYQREYFTFEDYPTIGAAIDFIMKRDQELMNARWKAQIERNRPRIVDRIIV